MLRGLASTVEQAIDRVQSFLDDFVEFLGIVIMFIREHGVDGKGFEAHGDFRNICNIQISATFQSAFIIHSHRPQDNIV